MNRTTAVIALLAAALLATAPVGAQEGAAAMGEITVPVKDYKSLDPPAVYRAARSGIQADVRFEDEFAQRAAVPGRLARVELGGYSYRMVTAFRTAGDLLCLVPDTSTYALTTLFGLPAGTPLGPAVLDQRMALNEGQKLVVEGTIVGEVGVNKVVVVDAVIVGTDERPRPFHGIQILWPGAQAPVFITEPGEHEVSVGSSVVPGQSIAAEVEIVEMTNRELMEEVAQAAAQREGVTDARKTYGEYDAGVVYRHATENNAISVDFTDRVNRIIGFEVPRAISSVPAFRGGVIVDVPVGFAFSTQAGLTCVVGADQPVLMARAASALPGEQVRIRGNVIGRSGAFSLVLADYIGFPEQAQLTREDTAWVALLSWPDTYPRVFWTQGTYMLVDLPSPYAPGRFERVQITLGEFRKIEVPGAVPPGAAGGGEGM